MSIDFYAFLEDIEQVIRKHGVSIAHEDGHGAFILRPLRESDVRWLRDAERHDAKEAGA